MGRELLPQAEAQRLVKAMGPQVVDRHREAGGGEALSAEGLQRGAHQHGAEALALRFGGHRDLADVPVRAGQMAREQDPHDPSGALGEKRAFPVEAPATGAEDQGVHEPPAEGRGCVGEVERGIQAPAVAAEDDLGRGGQVLAARGAQPE